MQKRAVYIDSIGEQALRVVVEDGRAVEVAITEGQTKSLVGNLYLGRVANLMPAMQAAFVDIGLDKNAFLPLQDVPSVLQDAAPEKPAIAQRKLKQGQEVIVQVLKEPGGSKGPRVTMNPTLAGAYVVLLPTVAAVGVSRHIEEEAERRRLTEAGRAIAPGGMGVIMRTSSEGIDADSLCAEAEALASQWQALRQAAVTRKPPALLYSEGDLAAQACRDLGVEPLLQPLPDTLAARLEKDLRRKVWLDSGGYLIFDYTEALTVIDVNSGKYAGKGSLSETALRLNTEAAREIARQIRLRDLGGIILVDFVDMESDADRLTVLDAFREVFASDRAKSHIYGFTQAGLLELTRRPLHKPVRELMLASCPHCHGTGTLPAPSYEAHQILRGIRRRRDGGDESVITIEASGPVRDVLHGMNLPENVILQANDIEKEANE